MRKSKLSLKDIPDLEHVAQIVDRGFKKVISLDLGTKTGYAVFDNNHIVSGTINFKGDRFEGGGMRYLKFKRWLNKMSESVGDIDAVFFEEVRRHEGVSAAHAYGAFFGVLTSWCEANNISYLGVPVGTIKKFITGKGNASKEEVIKSVKEKGHNPQDDNEADALALMHYAKWVFENDFENNRTHDGNNNDK